MGSGDNEIIAAGMRCRASGSRFRLKHLLCTVLNRYHTCTSFLLGKQSFVYYVIVINRHHSFLENVVTVERRAGQVRTCV